MKALTIRNPAFLLAADPTLAGAAVKLLLVPNVSEDMSETQLRSASGLSPYLWRERRAEIFALLDNLQGADRVA